MGKLHCCCESVRDFIDSELTHLWELLGHETMKLLVAIPALPEGKPDLSPKCSLVST